MFGCVGDEGKDIKIELRRHKTSFVDALGEFGLPSNIYNVYLKYRTKFEAMRNAGASIEIHDPDPTAEAQS